MIQVNTVQAAFVAWLRTQTTITALVTSAEIRETEWQGTDFTYPNIRISTLITPNQCAPHELELIVVVASDQKSSKQTNQIAGAIIDLIQEKSFTYNAVKFLGLKSEQFSKAGRTEENIWETELSVVGQVS